MPLTAPATFIFDVDPGFRFFFLCRAVAKDCPDVARMITEYSRSEYVEASQAFCRPLIVHPPLAIAEKIGRWVQLKLLMSEHRTFGYEPVNLPVRMLFAHFMSFCQDKLERPEFFCWPGARMTGQRATPNRAALFERQSAPFLDKPDDTGISSAHGW